MKDNQLENNISPPEISWDGWDDYVSNEESPEIDSYDIDFSCGNDLFIENNNTDKEIISACETVPEITVFDAVCGSGKTHHIMELVNKSERSNKFLYITPLIDECHRIAGTEYQKDDVFKRPILEDVKGNFTFNNVGGKNVQTKNYAYDKKHILANRLFKHPDYCGGNKAYHLKQLMTHKENIVSTHQLFCLLTPEHLVNASEYTLVIDEAMSVFNYYSGLSVKETQLLFRKKLLSVAEDGYTLIFNKENFGREVFTTEDTKYEELAELCDAKQLAVIDESYVIWMLNVDLIKSFKEVWVATYLFEGSQMDSFFKSHQLQYKKVTFGKSPQDFLDLVKIHGVNDNRLYADMVKSRFNKLNTCGDKWFSLSASDFKNNEDELTNTLRRNMLNFNNNITKTDKKKHRYHTVFKDYDSKVSGKKYKNEWLPFNIKATNLYNDCHTLAYMINLFVQPDIKRLCHLMGFPISDEQFALSELIQWIYRSRLRNNEEIYLYIPSVRMRELLICWMNEWEFSHLDIHKR